MDEIFKKRHSIRSFQKKEVEDEKIKEILEVIDSAPSAGNLKAREVIVIKDLEAKRKLAEAADGQGSIIEAPVVFVFFGVPSRSAKKYGERGRKLYSLQDVTIACSFAWLQAIILGLSCCWVGAFDEKEVKNALEILADGKEDWRPIAILPIGYGREGEIKIV